jgi:hypothetical protein
VAEDVDTTAHRSAIGTVAAWVALLAGLAIVVGALAAVFWSGVVALPSYVVQADGSAVISETGLTEMVASDVWYSITGALVGAGLGLVAWKWFRYVGWPVALFAVGAGLLAGGVCWAVGVLIGPGSFDARLAAAKVGDVVPIALQLRSWSALAIWGFAAITPVLLGASLGADEEDPPRRKVRNEAPEDVPEVDELGVVAPAESVGSDSDIGNRRTSQ